MIGFTRIQGTVSPPLAPVLFILRDGGIFNGTLYAPQRFEATADANGVFEISVPPSSAVGDYDIVIARKRFIRERVPDQPPGVRSVSLLDVLGGTDA